VYSQKEVSRGKVKMSCGVYIFLLIMMHFSSSFFDSNVKASLLRRTAHLVSGGRDVTVSIRDVIKQGK